MQMFLFLVFLLCNFNLLFAQNQRVQYVEMAELLIEKEDPKQLDLLREKLKSAQESPASVFDEEGYYLYNTENTEFQAGRGSASEIKENLNWFLMIDNLMFADYLWEFDWKASFYDIEYGLEEMAEKKNYTLPDFPALSDDLMAHDIFPKLN